MTGRKRVRLPANVRARRILEAALAEFSRLGFAGTRIEDIGRGAGLSKSGVYAHYPSKEAIFEALLGQALAPVDVVPFDKGDSVADFVDRFLEQTYSRLAEPASQAMLRLLLAEAGRVPELVRRWHRDLVEPFHRRQAAILRAAAARGQVVAAAAECFEVAYSPVLQWALSPILSGADASPRLPPPERLAAHRRMLLALLSAPVTPG